MNYVKLNNNDNHLSFGNFLTIIKKISTNKSSAIQTELFCILFNVESISDSTVGNYATGYRAIGNEYKQIYLNYKKHYQEDKTIFINTINNLLSIIDGIIYNINTIEELNNNKSLKLLCQKLHTLAKNDLSVSQNLKKELLHHLKNKNYYEFVIAILFFIILEKQQPIYEKDLINETLEEILRDTNMSVNDLKKYLEVIFKKGISLVPSLKKLAKENNPYALHELGNMEYNGYISGIKNYPNALNYYKQAAAFDHPTACWMIAHMIVNKKIGSLDSNDIKLAWSYLEKAHKLNSISALNTMGICYLHGYTKNKQASLDKAIKYFSEAAKHKYIYAYNNLGKIYENKKDYYKAIEYYTLSAEAENSWACNKMGMYYYEGKHIEKDDQKAFEYFTTGANAPITTRISWNTYNLVKLFYLKGNATLNIEKDLNKSLSMLDTIKDFEPANELYLYCYYELYLEKKEKKYLDKINYYLNILNTNLDKSLKKEIETNLNNIYKINIKL